jgi:hypothetical protein
MANKLIRKLERVGRQFLSAPFANLPSEYGDPVPPEMRAFEARAEVTQREVREQFVTPVVRGRRSQRARRDESLERE